jgi:hypothetical protein
VTDTAAARGGVGSHHDRQHYCTLASKESSLSAIVPVTCHVVDVDASSWVWAISCCLPIIRPHFHPQRYFHYYPSNREFSRGLFVSSFAWPWLACFVVARHRRLTVVPGVPGGAKLCCCRPPPHCVQSNTVLSWNMVCLTLSAFPIHSSLRAALLLGEPTLLLLLTCSAYSLSDVLFVFVFFFTGLCCMVENYSRDTRPACAY